MKKSTLTQKGNQKSNSCAQLRNRRTHVFLKMFKNPSHRRWMPDRCTSCAPRHSADCVVQRYHNKPPRFGKAAASICGLSMEQVKSQYGPKDKDGAEARADPLPVPSCRHKLIALSESLQRKRATTAITHSPVGFFWYFELGSRE